MSDGGALPNRASTHRIGHDLTGTWRRFGEVGPVYEIIGIRGTAPDGAALMRVRVVETGEEIDYPLRDVLTDPHAE